MANNDRLNCPHCGSDNTVSVPLAYKRGHATGTAVHTEIVGYNVETTTTTYGDGHTSTRETGRTPIYGNVKHDTYTMTDLAREIAPPEEPEKPTREDIGSFTSWIGVFVIFGSSFFITGEILSLFSFNSGITNFFIGFIMWCGLNYAGAKIFDKIWFDITGKNKRYKQALEDYDKELLNYREACRNWENSYICMRCGHRFFIE